MDQPEPSQPAAGPSWASDSGSAAASPVASTPPKKTKLEAVKSEPPASNVNLQQEVDKELEKELVSVS